MTKSILTNYIGISSRKYKIREAGEGGEGMLSPNVGLVPIADGPSMGNGVGT